MTNQGLKKTGLKVTAPRLKILEILERANPRHMNAEDVHRALRDSDNDVGLATVYRALTQFEIAGLVRRHNFNSGQAVFEIEAGEHHDHMVCAKCACVTEFTDTVIEEQQKKIAERAGFEITDHHLTIHGICRACRET